MPSQTELIHDLKHSREVSCCACSPDGLLVVSGSRDKTLKIWHVRTGALLMTLAGHSDRILAVCFTADGHIMSGSRDGTVRKWEAKTGVHVATLPVTAQLSKLQDCCFGPGGCPIVSVTDETGPRDLAGMGQVWDGKSGQHRFSLTTRLAAHLRDGIRPDHQNWIDLLSISPTGRLILTGSVDDYSTSIFPDNVVRTWCAVTGQHLATLQNCHGHFASLSCSISPDETMIVTTAADRTLRLWDTKTGKLQATLKGHCGAVTASKFSPNGKTILSASEGVNVPGISKTILHLKTTT
jgi:WD40 repeat protein